MATTNTNDQSADGGTMDARGDAHRGAVAAKAQTELIDMLARLVLASVEHGAASIDREPTNRRSGQRGSQKPEQRAAVAISTPGKPPTAGRSDLE